MICVKIEFCPLDWYSSSPTAILLYNRTYMCIAVPAQKNLGGNEVLPKFCDVCSNHDFIVYSTYSFIVHYGYDKKIV